MDTSELKQLLSERIVTVTFTKVDGATRKMACTTNPSIIPAQYHPTGRGHLSEAAKERTMRVFDVTAQGWRSFRLDSVTEVE